MYQYFFHLWMLHLLVKYCIVISSGPIVDTVLVGVVSIQQQGCHVAINIVCCCLISNYFDHVLSSGDIVIDGFRILSNSTALDLTAVLDSTTPFDTT